MIQAVKVLVKRHKRVYAAYRFFRVRVIGKRVAPVVSWGEAYDMAADWARFLVRERFDVVVGEDWARFLVRERFDVVVGVPRAGLFVAEVLAAELGLPLSTPDNFLRGEVWDSSRLPVFDWRVGSRVLVVDDSVSSGETLLRVRDLLVVRFPEFKFFFGCLCLVGKEAVGLLDFVYCYSADWVTAGDVRKFRRSLFGRGYLPVRVRVGGLVV